MSVFASLFSTHYWLGAVSMLVLVMVSTRLNIPVLSNIVKSLLGIK